MSKFADVVAKHGGVACAATAALKPQSGHFAVDNEAPAELKVSPMVKLEDGQAISSPSSSSKPMVSLPAAPSSPSTAGGVRSNVRRSTFRRQTARTTTMALTGLSPSGAEDKSSWGGSNAGSPAGQRKRDGTMFRSSAGRPGSKEPVSPTSPSKGSASEGSEEDIARLLSGQSFYKLHEKVLNQSVHMQKLVNSCYRPKELRQVRANASVQMENLGFGDIMLAGQEADDAEEEYDSEDELFVDPDDPSFALHWTLDDVVTDGRQRIDELFAKFASHKRMEILKDTASWLHARAPGARREAEELAEYEATLEDKNEDLESESGDFAILGHMREFFNRLEAKVRDGHLFERDMEELNKARFRYEQVQGEGTDSHRLKDIQDQVKELREELLSLDTKEDAEIEKSQHRKAEMDQLSAQLQNRQHEIQLLVDSRRKTQELQKTMKVAVKQMEQFADARSTSEFIDKLNLDVMDRVSAISHKLFEEDSYKLVAHDPQLQRLKAKIQADREKAMDLDEEAVLLQEKAADHRKQLVRLFVNDDDPASSFGGSVEEFSSRLDQEFLKVTQESYDLERTALTLKGSTRTMNASANQMEEAKKLWKQNIETAAANLLIFCSYPEAEEQARAELAEQHLEEKPSRAWQERLEVAWLVASKDIDFYKAFAEHYPEAPDAEVLAEELEATKNFANEHLDKIWDVLDPGPVEHSSEVKKDLAQLSEEHAAEMQQLGDLHKEISRTADFCHQLQGQLKVKSDTVKSNVVKSDKIASGLHASPPKLDSDQDASASEKSKDKDDLQPGDLTQLLKSAPDKVIKQASATTKVAKQVESELVKRPFGGLAVLSNDRLNKEVLRTKNAIGNSALDDLDNNRLSREVLSSRHSNAHSALHELGQKRGSMPSESKRLENAASRQSTMSQPGSMDFMESSRSPRGSLLSEPDIDSALPRRESASPRRDSALPRQDSAAPRPDSAASHRESTYLPQRSDAAEASQRASVLGGPPQRSSVSAARKQSGRQSGFDALADYVERTQPTSQRPPRRGSELAAQAAKMQQAINILP